jgi:hypothetical protein
LLEDASICGKRGGILVWAGGIPRFRVSLKPGKGRGGGGYGTPQGRTGGRGGVAGHVGREGEGVLGRIRGVAGAAGSPDGRDLWL